jgi:hypothetical protein
MSPAGLGPENECAGEDPSGIVYHRPILSPEGKLLEDYDCKCSTEPILAVSLKVLGAKTK